MKKLKTLIILLTILLTSGTCFALTVVTEINYGKQINDNAGMEFLIKTTIPFKGYGDLKIGVSEGYTAFRANPYSMNHAGQRLDLGFYWDMPFEFKAGYTHSIRNWFDGANPIDIFDYDSIDTISVRKEFEI